MPHGQGTLYYLVHKYECLISIWVLHILDFQAVVCKVQYLKEPQMLSSVMLLPAALCKQMHGRGPSQRNNFCCMTHTLRTDPDTGNTGCRSTQESSRPFQELGRPDQTPPEQQWTRDAAEHDGL